jgi:UDP-N-acetylmuramate dehydrogenase
MVLDETEQNSRSCGSFFMNPIVTADQHKAVLEVLRRDSLLRDGEEMPAFPAGEGHVKLSAAWLMQRAGLKRGLQHGKVGLSEKHVLAIVNRGGGTAREVLELVGIVQETVRGRFGVQLEPEPVFIGLQKAGAPAEHGGKDYPV